MQVALVGKMQKGRRSGGPAGRLQVKTGRYKRQREMTALWWSWQWGGGKGGAELWGEMGPRQVQAK